MSPHFSQTDDQSFLDAPDDFHLQPEADIDSYSDEYDFFADSQIDRMVEETKMRSARSFSRFLDARANKKTRRSKCFRSKSNPNS